MKQLCRPVHAASPRGRSRRAVPAWLLLFAHALAFLHLALTPHFIAAGEGHVAHALPDYPVPADMPCAPEPGTQHENCIVFSALTQAAGVTSIATVTVPAGYNPVPAIEFLTQAPPPSRRELHRLSPSNSPPFVA